MKYLIAGVSLAFLMGSCGKDEAPKEKEIIVEERTSSLVIGDPLDCGLEGTLMFPIGTSYNPEVFEPPKDANGNIMVSDATTFSGYSNMSFEMNSGIAFDKLALTEYINDQSEDFDITNILFYNIASGDSYPLIENDTLHILSFAIHKEFDNPMIFYRAVRNDFNLDEKFNSNDPIMLFASPLNGDTLIQITPDNQQFIDYFYYEENQKILAKTRIDADSDTLYTPADETNFVEMDLNNPGAGNPLFPDGLKKTLKGQLNL